MRDTGGTFDQTRRQAVAVLEAAARGEVSSVYLFYGPDDYQRQTIVRHLIERLLPPEHRDTRLTVLSNDAATPKRVAAELESAGFDFGDEPRRVVLVRDAPFFRSEAAAGAEILADRIEAGLLSDVIVIFDVRGAVDRRWKLTKAVLARGTVLEFPALSGEADVASFLEARARRARKRLSGDAVAALIERCGSDAQVLRLELDKLICYVGERDTIEAEDVRRMVAPTVELSQFELIDAVIEQKPRAALDQLEALLDQQAEPFVILAMLIRQFRLLLQARYLLDAGIVDPGLLRLRPSEFNRRINEQRNGRAELERWRERAAGTLPNDAKLDLLRQHHYPLWKTLGAARRLDSARIEAGLERLLQADLALKSSRLPVRQELELLVVDLCTRMTQGATIDWATLLEPI